MDEATWLSSNDPAAMLDYLRNKPKTPHGAGYDRKPHPCCTDRKLRLFCWSAMDQFKTASYMTIWRRSNWENGEPDKSDGPNVPIDLARSICGEGLYKNLPLLLRDIFGNPCRPVELEWHEGKLCQVNYAHHGMALGLTKYFEPVSWLTPDVLAIAQTIYEQRRFEDMPILADALEDAGCEDWEMLSHCRKEETCPVCMGGKDRKKCKNCWEGNIPLRGPHVRGCWVVDLILDKE